MKHTFFSVPVLLGLVVGCGSTVNPNAPAKVKGTVTYKNAPVTGGNLIFHKEGTYPVVIMPDGTYQGVDLPVGETTITVETESLNVKPQTYGGKKAMSSAPPPGAATGAAGVYVKIPEKYRSPKTSPLKLNVINGDQVHNIELTD
jgi:hypothetical protein